MSSCCIGFGNCNLKEVLTFRIKGTRQDKSPFLVQVLNMQKSISVNHILATVFGRCIDIFPDGTYLDARLKGFLYSQCLVDPFGKGEVFITALPSIGHSSMINDIIQGWLNSVIEIIKGFAVLGVGLNISTMLLAECVLATFV